MTRAGHALLALAACALLLQACTPVVGGSGVTKDIEGRIFFPPGEVAAVSTIQVTLTLESGKQLRAYPHSNMTFWLRGVPPGGHILDTAALGFIMPSIRLDVDEDGGMAASFAEAPLQSLTTSPLLVRAVPVDYFDKIVPFNIMAFLKSPMGMMMGFMVFAVVVMPYLKVDPEEMKEMLAERKGEKPAGIAAAATERLIAGSSQPQRTLGSGGAQQRSRARR